MTPRRALEPEQDRPGHDEGLPLFARVDEMRPVAPDGAALDAETEAWIVARLLAAGEMWADEPMSWLLATGRVRDDADYVPNIGAILARLAARRWAQRTSMERASTVPKANARKVRLWTAMEPIYTAAREARRKESA